MILFNTSWGTYSISKESKYAAKFLSINNETQCGTLLFLSSRFITYSPSFILDKLVLEKTPLDLQSFTKYLRPTLVFMWNIAVREKFFVFQKFLFFKSVLLILTKFSFWQEDWALGYHFMKFWDFPYISQFPKSYKSFFNSWGKLYIRYL